jgi:hypothetical protein
MDRDELAIIEAAQKQGVSVHRNAAGNYEVGLTVRADPLTADNRREVDALLGDGMIRLASGRTLKMELRPDEARKEFGVEG